MARKNKNPEWWKIFIKEYLTNGNNGSAAYKLTHPKASKETCEVNASRLLSNAKFNNELSTAKKKLEDKLEMSKEEWLRLHADIARFDIRDFITIDSTTGDTQLVPDWKEKPNGHAISEMQIATTTQESGAVVQRVKIVRDSKLGALTNIGKALGYVEDKVKVSGEVKLTAAEALARLKSELGEKAVEAVTG